MSKTWLFTAYGGALGYAIYATGQAAAIGVVIVMTIMIVIDTITLNRKGS